MMNYCRQLHPNQQRYLRSPTYEEVMIVVKAHGVPVEQFERFYGIYVTCIKQMRRSNGTKPLPARYWHIIYENLQKIENREPLPIWNPTNGIIPLPQKKLKRTKKKKYSNVKKVGLIKELL